MGSSIKKKTFTIASLRNFEKTCFALEGELV